MDYDNIESILNLNTEHGEKISKTRLRHIWHQLYPKKSLPKILAFVVSKERFFNVMDQVREHHIKYSDPNYIETCIKQEWGKIVEASAFVINTDIGYLVLIRSDSPYPLEEDLKHELKHIHDGEVGTGIETIKSKK